MKTTNDVLSIRSRRIGLPSFQPQIYRPASPSAAGGLGICEKIENRIIAFMNAFSQGRSGSDVVFVEVAKRLNSYKKVIVTSSLGKELCDENNVKARFYITTKEQVFERILVTYLIRIVRAVLIALTFEGDNIVLSTSDFLPDVLPGFILKVKNRKNIWVQHIFHIILPSRKFPHYGQKLSFLFVRKFADVVVVDNNLLMKELVRLGFSSEKIVVNYPGLALDYLRGVKARDSNYDGVFMAQLREAKGIFDLVEIWELVCRDLPSAKLAIIGKGNIEDTRKMRGMIDEYELNQNIDVLGFLPDDEAFGTIKSSKLCVFPSHEEGFGIVPLEAQTLGVPVVGWDLPVYEEIFPKGMVKVRHGESEEFAKKVVELLRNENERGELSAFGIENSARFDWNKTVNKEVEIFNDLLKEKNEN